MISQLADVEIVCRIADLCFEIFAGFVEHVENLLQADPTQALSACAPRHLCDCGVCPRTSKAMSQALARVRYPFHFVVCLLFDVSGFDRVDAILRPVRTVDYLKLYPRRLPSSIVVREVAT